MPQLKHVDSRVPRRAAIEARLTELALAIKKRLATRSRFTTLPRGQFSKRRAIGLETRAPEAGQRGTTRTEVISILWIKDLSSIARLGGWLAAGRSEDYTWSELTSDPSRPRWIIDN